MISWLRKLKEIKDGWVNDAFPTEEITKMADERAVKCAMCPLNVNNTCSKKKNGSVVKTFGYEGEIRIQGEVYPGCGCPISKKTKSPNSKCPLGKW